MTSPQLRSPENFEIKNIIDSGNYGTVYKILVPEDQKFYAVKQINLEKYDEKDRPQVLRDLKMEYNLLRNTSSNVLKSFGSNYDEHHEVFKYSLELIETNLSQYVKSRGGSLLFEEFIPIFSDILNGEKK